ncbi:MAG: aldo/keto reductase [Bacteroides sp.]|nr:aldo/keto reductase [Roseburia sp.]MCM1345672.1 aldo/keto reductase [Bacteroides sp.]MCM1419907.1 aldo/keto reductase [Bacteroides sp.]
MTERRLSNLTVSPIGLGCMGMSHAYGLPADKKEMKTLLANAVEMGYTLFDTAEVYGTDCNPHENEELIGEALKPYRDKVVITTKFGLTFDKSHEPGPYPLRPNSNPHTIRRAVEGSLRRLQTDHIDLYLQHRIDPVVEPETVAETMSELIKEGKILHWGISETTASYLRRAHTVCHVTAIQNRYSMMARWHEEIFPTIEELNVGFIAFSPLANGLLSGFYTADSKFNPQNDYRAAMPQFSRKSFEENKMLLGLIRKIADENHATPSQISLAWMLCKKPYIVPIPGTRHLCRLKENIGATDITLSSEDVEAIDRQLNSTPMSEVFGGSKIVESQKT